MGDMAGMGRRAGGKVWPICRGRRRPARRDQNFLGGQNRRQWPRRGLFIVFFKPGIGIEKWRGDIGVKLAIIGARMRCNVWS